MEHNRVGSLALEEEKCYKKHKLHALNFFSVLGACLYYSVISRKRQRWYLQRRL